MSAVLQEKPIETIYDHNPTALELEELTCLTEEEYQQFVSQDTAFAELYWLYDMRGDHDKAAKYLGMIQDKLYKISITMNCCHNH